MPIVVVVHRSPYNIVNSLERYEYCVHMGHNITCKRGAFPISFYVPMRHARDLKKEVTVSFFEIKG